MAANNVEPPIVDNFKLIIGNNHIKKVAEDATINKNTLDQYRIQIPDEFKSDIEKFMFILEIVFNDQIREEIPSYETIRTEKTDKSIILNILFHNFGQNTLGITIGISISDPNATHNRTIHVTQTTYKGIDELPDIYITNYSQFARRVLLNTFKLDVLPNKGKSPVSAAPAANYQQQALPPPWLPPQQQALPPPWLLPQQTQPPRIKYVPANNWWGKPIKLDILKGYYSGIYKGEYTDLNGETWILENGKFDFYDLTSDNFKFSGSIQYNKTKRDLKIDGTLQKESPYQLKFTMKDEFKYKDFTCTFNPLQHKNSSSPIILSCDGPNNSELTLERIDPSRPNTWATGAFKNAHKGQSGSARKTRRKRALKKSRRIRRR